VKIALIHDLPECFTGDLTPSMKKHIPKKLLKNIEKRIIREFFGEGELSHLFDEYLERSSPEARLVHLLDRLEMLAEANYIRKKQGIRLSSFK